MKNFAGVEEGESMGHTFDGIEELNNPIPKWWSTFFLFTIIWGLFYFAWFGIGHWTGFSGWQSSNQGILNVAEGKAATIANLKEGSGIISEYDREMARANEKYGPIFDAYAARSIEDLATDKEALKVGQRLFLQNCSQCHGSDARGVTGFPNLTDNDWLYASTPEAIKSTIMHGRQAQGMIAWETMLGGEDGVKDVAAYVISLSNREAKEGDVQAGKAKFAMCTACHGDQGQGSAVQGIMLGAPTLSDNIWLYGGSERAIQASIRNGRAGVMPAWKDILGEEKVHVVSAYVYSLSQNK
jgi:cytochrome c oxidase cbb3-type subunit 3